MKINNKKIIVSTLALAMGASLAGSVAGSVAWYQYSTRAAALVQGTSAGTLGRLQLKSNFGSDFTDYETIDPQNFRPVSITNTAGTLAWFDQPVYQVPQAPAMLDSNKGYVDYTFSFKFETKDQDNDWADAATRNVYLSHFAIVNAGAANDVSSAVRVAFLAQDGVTAMKIFEKDEAGNTTTTHGTLDLNKNTRVDTTAWDCQDAEAVAAVPGTPLANGAHGADGVKYYTKSASSAGAGYLNDGSNAYSLAGEGTAFEADADNTYFPLTEVGSDAEPEVIYQNAADSSYTTDAHSSLVLTAGEQANIYDLDTTVAAKKVCTTAQTLTLRVWLEGWAQLGSPASASWADTYLKQNFNIQLQFMCQADR